MTPTEANTKADHITEKMERYKNGHSHRAFVRLQDEVHLDLLKGASRKCKRKLKLIKQRAN